MKKLLSVSIGVLALAMSACVPAVNLEQERAALFAVDAAWNEAAGAMDLERTIAFFADDASMLPTNAPIVTGQEAVRGLWSGLFAVPDLDLSWKASVAEVARSGDLGYTRGTYQISMTDPAGPVTDHGKYVTVWQKQADGNWKILADIWNSDQPLEGAHL